MRVTIFFFSNHAYDAMLIVYLTLLLKKCQEFLQNHIIEKKNNLCDGILIIKLYGGGGCSCHNNVITTTVILMEIF